MKELFAIASLVASLAANIPYVKETLQGKVKPERISWLLWTMLGATYFFSEVFGKGAVLFTSGELFGPALIFIISIKYGVGGKSRFDFVSLTIALVAFGLLFVLSGVLLSLILALVVDGIGAILTIRKLLLDPASESRGFWILAAVASSLALLSLNTYSLETMLFPVYVLVLGTYISIKAKPGENKNIVEIEKF